jgi:diacylglycerol kinase
MSGLPSGQRPAPTPAVPVKGAHGVARSFGWALTGLVETALRERNLRIQLAGGVLASAFAATAPLGAVERALVLLCVALVIAAEAMNSALEATVDLAAPEWREHARIAKDAAAGAVLTIACGAALVLGAVAWPLLPVLVAGLPDHAPDALGALGAAVAAGALPAPFRRPLAADLALGVGGAACLVPVARAAQSPAPLLAAGVLLLLGVEAARRKARAR